MELVTTFFHSGSAFQFTCNLLSTASTPNVASFQQCTPISNINNFFDFIVKSTLRPIHANLAGNESDPQMVPVTQIPTVNVVRYKVAAKHSNRKIQKTATGR